MPKLTPGEPSMLGCADCEIEFSITLEPRAKTKKGIESEDLNVCPFCGQDALESNDGEDEKEESAEKPEAEEEPDEDDFS